MFEGEPIWVGLPNTGDAMPVDSATCLDFCSVIFVSVANWFFLKITPFSCLLNISSALPNWPSFAFSIANSTFLICPFTLNPSFSNLFICPLSLNPLFSAANIAISFFRTAS